MMVKWPDREHSSSITGQKITFTAEIALSIQFKIETCRALVLKDETVSEQATVNFVEGAECIPCQYWRIPTIPNSS